MTNPTACPYCGAPAEMVSHELPGDRALAEQYPASDAAARIRNVEWRYVGAVEAGSPPPYDFAKLRRDLRDAYISARESGLAVADAFECALDEAVPSGAP